jgi:hypothetical protein
MNTIENLLNHCPHHLCESHIQRAWEIESGLKNGQPYSTLGGMRIRCRTDLIRFKLSPALRLIYQKSPDGYAVVALVTREAFDREIKRRRA